MNCMSVACKAAPQRATTGFSFVRKGRGKYFLTCVDHAPVFAAKLTTALEEYREHADLEAIGEKTEEAAKVKLAELIQLYETVSTKSRKVIAYKLLWSSQNIKSNELRWGHQDGHYSDEVKLEFEHKVLIERSIGDKALYFSEREHAFKPGVITLDEERIDDDTWDVIEWSAEGEAFMAQFYVAMETLVKRLKKHVGSPKAMKKAIELSLVLLEGPAEPPVKKQESEEEE